MTIEHKAISNFQLHEPKDVNGATISTAYISDGVGSGTWKQPTIAGQTTSGLNTTPISDGSGGISWELAIQFNEVFLASDFSDQSPSGLDIPTNVTYGTPQSTTYFDLAADGLLTVNVTGKYYFLSTYYVHRDNTAGTAFFFIRATVDNVQVGNPVGLQMEDAAVTIPLQFVNVANLTAGQEIRTQMVRDGLGVDNGGIIGLPTTSWGPTPSALIRIFKLA